jgi:hypothetical protein
MTAKIILLMMIEAESMITERRINQRIRNSSLIIYISEFVEYDICYRAAFRDILNICV